jgi:DNA modification methylase
MAFTDPPYNVDLGHGGRSDQRTIANDALSPEDWEAFLHAWVPLLVERVEGALYVAMSSREWPTICRALAEAGAHWSDTIIWAKHRFVLGRSDYQRRYEPIWYGWREGGPHHWCGDRDQDDVWEIARPTHSPEHPTMKPVALVERAIRNSSKRGARVFDPFLGSGTTLIAAERLGRSCLGIELEPRYVQVALERWQTLTGRRAERVS